VGDAAPEERQVVLPDRSVQPQELPSLPGVQRSRSRAACYRRRVELRHGEEDDVRDQRRHDEQEAGPKQPPDEKAPRAKLDDGGKKAVGIAVLRKECGLGRV
jgi:hypothetical protein